MGGGREMGKPVEEGVVAVQGGGQAWAAVWLRGVEREEWLLELIHLWDSKFTGTRRRMDLAPGLLMLRFFLLSPEG